MRDFLIDLFMIIPFVVNGVSLTAGVLLWLWLILQRKIRHEKHTKAGE